MWMHSGHIRTHKKTKPNHTHNPPDARGRSRNHWLQNDSRHVRHDSAHNCVVRCKGTSVHDASLQRGLQADLQAMKRSKLGTTPYPRRGSASAPLKGRKEGGQPRATRDEGDNERGRKQLCTRPAANTHSSAGTAASATEAPTKRT
jgi:hypothetical protein